MATHQTGKPKLSDVLPPIIFGTAPFNFLYNLDPFALRTNDLVYNALQSGIRAFDTSPYYGPAEEILGAALSTSQVTSSYRRQDYFLLTKAGRIGGESFDYSPEWIRKSVLRSLERLKTGYLDVVYCHDVEFVSAQEVLGAVEELRKLRNEGLIRWVGISGYPVDVLCDLAELIKEKTGESLDVVMSYCHFTLQNTRLASQGLARFQAAGVDVVPNASILGMGLLRTSNVPVGAKGDWHPAPLELRSATQEASQVCVAKGHKLEDVALRYSIEQWMEKGSPLGSCAAPLLVAAGGEVEVEIRTRRRLGVTVIGVSSLAELDDTVKIWKDIIEEDELLRNPDHKNETAMIAEEFKKSLGKWYDFSWDSPPKGFVNQRPNP
jgi:D-arabinose 1-dehydrogenase